MMGRREGRHAPGGLLSSAGQAASRQVRIQQDRIGGPTLKEMFALTRRQMHSNRDLAFAGYGDL